MPSPKWLWHVGDKQRSIGWKYVAASSELGKETDKISFEKLMNTTAPLNGPEQFFVKKIEHQIHSEYRMIWNTDRVVTDHIIIKCPEAIKFCEKVDSLANTYTGDKTAQPPTNR